MNENETMETSVVSMESVLEKEAPVGDAQAQSALAQSALAQSAITQSATALYATEVDPALLSEADGVRAVYPDFDLTAELAHPVMGAILRGEEKPSLRQLYEAIHMDGIVESRVAAAVQAQVEEAVTSAVTEAVSTAVRECEERLLGHIRARGQRPAENGVSAAAGIRMHPAVGRLTRRERAMLAKRAELGETIKL